MISNGGGETQTTGSKAKNVATIAFSYKKNSMVSLTERQSGDVQTDTVSV